MQGLSHVVLLLCPWCTPARDARPSLGSPPLSAVAVWRKMRLSIWRNLSAWRRCGVSYVGRMCAY